MQCGLPINRALYSKMCCCWHRENKGRKTSKPASTGLVMWIIPKHFFLSLIPNRISFFLFLFFEGMGGAKTINVHFSYWPVHYKVTTGQRPTGWLTPLLPLSACVAPQSHKLLPLSSFFTLSVTWCISYISWWTAESFIPFSQACFISYFKSSCNSNFFTKVRFIPIGVDSRSGSRI